MNQSSGFSIDCCPHPNPSLASRALRVPEGLEQLASRQVLLAQQERGARSSNCKQPLAGTRRLHKQTSPLTNTASANIHITPQPTAQTATPAYKRPTEYSKMTRLPAHQTVKKCPMKNHNKNNIRSANFFTKAKVGNGSCNILKTMRENSPRY